MFAEKTLHAKRSMQIVEIRYLWPSFNDFAIKNFTSFIAMALIIARKAIPAVFGTMALQLIEVFQCSVTYSMKQASAFFWLLQCFHWFYSVWLQLKRYREKLFAERRRARSYKANAWWFNVISNMRGRAFQEQQPDRSGGETARNYSADSSVIHFQIFFNVLQRKANNLRKTYKRTGSMNVLYSWERDSLEGPYEAEAMEWSALIRGKNFVRREWTCEPTEWVRAKVTSRNLGFGQRSRLELNERKVPVNVIGKSMTEK